jgi:hypothetical protein
VIVIEILNKKGLKNKNFPLPAPIGAESDGGCAAALLHAGTGKFLFSFLFVNLDFNFVR